MIGNIIGLIFCWSALGILFLGIVELGLKKGTSTNDLPRNQKIVLMIISGPIIWIISIMTSFYKWITNN